MSLAQTFELTLLPHGEREALLAVLAEFGIDDFVESAAELNADDTDWDEAFQAWSQTENAPIIIYRSTREELEPLLAALQERFRGRIGLKELWIADTLWQEAWEPGFESLETERFFIAAEGVEGGAGRIRIRLREAEVFGSGQHATTQALVRLLEAQPQRSGESFLDVGTGTGVLCLVARALGYGSLCGTDIEDGAIENARINAALNQTPIELILGSLPSEDRLWTTIACNILPPTLTDLLKDLKARLLPGGELYLAGFNEANADAIAAELRRLGLEVVEECRVRAWLAWRVR